MRLHFDHLKAACDRLEKGDLEPLKQWLKQGGSINDRCNNAFWAPIHFACYGQQVEAIHFLIDHGADVTALTKDSNSALHFLVNRSYDQMPPEKMLPIIDVLMQKGVTVDLSNHVNNTALHLSISNGLYQATERLITYDHHQSINWIMEDHQPSLHAAIRSGSHEVVHLVLTHQSHDHINVVNQDGQTALHLAVLANSISLVEILLNFGIDPTVKDHQDFTALELSKHYNNQSLTQFMEGYLIAQQERQDLEQSLLPSTSEPLPQPMSEPAPDATKVTHRL